MSSLSLGLFLLACTSTSVDATHDHAATTKAHEHHEQEWLQATTTPPSLTALADVSTLTTSTPHPLPVTVEWADATMTFQADETHGYAIQFTSGDANFELTENTSAKQRRDLMIVIGRCMDRIRTGQIRPMSAASSMWCRAKLDEEDTGRAIFLGIDGQRHVTLRVSFGREVEEMKTFDDPRVGPAGFGYLGKMPPEAWYQLGGLAAHLIGTYEGVTDPPTP